MPDEKADNNNELMAEFAEFLEAKRASEQESAEAEDFDVEIWDEKGRGVRTKRSHAKPFLQSLGIDLPPESGTDKTDDGDKSKNSKTSPRKAKPSESTVRKYFTAKSK